MTTSNDGFNGVACGKTFRKKVLPHDQPAIAITNSNPNNTSKSGFLSRLIYLVTCAFWKRNPEEADRVDPPDTPPEPARTRWVDGWLSARISRLSNLHERVRRKAGS
ncbi:hypothetical protein Tco_1574072, partial [Tanacetum coccineum]